MWKKFIVRLSDQERRTPGEVVAKLKGTSQKVRRAQILLKADADGSCWTDARIAEAFGCRTKTVENIRHPFVTQGFEVALQGKPRSVPVPKLLDGAQEAKLIAIACSHPPKGRVRWTLQLIADRMVELQVVPSISDDTVGRTLKKTNFSRTARNAG